MDSTYDLYLDLMTRSLRTGSTTATTKGRTEGRDSRARAHTMIGLKRLANFRMCVETVLERRCPGRPDRDRRLRGGATIFVRRFSRQPSSPTASCGWRTPSPGCRRRTQKTTRSDAGIAPDRLTLSWPSRWERVQENFRRYGLLDETGAIPQRLVPQYVATHQLNAAPCCVLMATFTNPRSRHSIPSTTNLRPGGFVIVDDYGNIEACRQAVHDFRAARGITDPIHPIDWGGVYWRRSRETASPEKNGAVPSVCEHICTTLVKGGSGGVTAAPPARRMRGQGGG